MVGCLDGILHDAHPVLNVLFDVVIANVTLKDVSLFGPHGPVRIKSTAFGIGLFSDASIGMRHIDKGPGPARVNLEPNALDSFILGVGGRSLVVWWKEEIPMSDLLADT